jgi:hypothetical protein
MIKTVDIKLQEWQIKLSHTRSHYSFIRVIFLNNKVDKIY